MKTALEQQHTITDDFGSYERDRIYSDVYIVGREFNGNIKLYFNEPVEIYKEPENPYDPHAMAVVVRRMGVPYRAGYLSAKSPLRDYLWNELRKVCRLRARVDNAELGTIAIAVYYERNYFNYYHKLTPEDDFRVHLRDCCADDFVIGDTAEVDYDYEKDRYTLCVGYEEVKLPADAEIYNSSRYVMFITDARDTQNGASVKISVYEE